MGKAKTGAIAAEAPLLILRIRVNATSELLSKLLQGMRITRGWGDSNTMHDLSHITASEDTRGHSALLYTGHTDVDNTTYPAAVWYALDDGPPPPAAARVLLTISARLHSQTVLDHVYDALKMLRASYPTISVELAEVPESFVDRNEALPDVFDFQIKPVVSLGGQPIEPVSIAPTHEPPAANAAQPAPWSLIGKPIEPTGQILANWERLQRESLNGVTQTPSLAKHPPSIEKAKSAKYGTERDLTYDDIKEIVTRCNAWTARGGKVSAFYESLKVNETGPRSFALETLRKWLRDPRFE